MPPKGKRSKAEEALDFLSNLDNLDAPSDAAAPPPSGSPAPATATGSTPRASTDSTRPKTSGGKSSTDLTASTELKRSGTPSTSTVSANTTVAPADEEAQKALDFLEAQINTKRAPLSAPKSSTPRPATPGPLPAPSAPAVQSQPQPNEPTAASAGGGGWGVGSFWSSATSAIQSAQKIADEQYKKVRTEGVQGVTQQLGQLDLKNRGVDLDALRKGAEQRLGGIQGYVKGVDLEKLRQDLLNTTSSTLTTILNTVAPPISAHETLELWLTHPMVGYSGVEGVVYRAWTKILEQTESGELIIVWSPETEGQDDGDRAINPVEGWGTGWERQEKEIDGVKSREEANPKGRARPNPSVPVTTVPIFLHLQPVLAPLPIPEPSILLKADSATERESPKHLYFLFTLHDPVHSLRFTTASQPSPADWLDVEYDKSDWVEERLVEVLRTGVEVVAQDYVATRMGLKPHTRTTRPASPETNAEVEVEASKAD